MPSNKEALIRYRAINRCIINKGIASKDDLIRACEEATYHDVSWRTVAEDIRAMRYDEQLGFEAPIENVVNEGYRYGMEGYSIDKIPLNSEEVNALNFASRLLMQFKDIGIFNTFGGAVEKLSEKLSFGLRERENKNLENIVAFEKSLSDGGSKWINSFLDCIRSKTVVRISYHSFSSGRKAEHVLHPYFLKEDRNRWYVVGWHDGYNEIRTLALERIDKLKEDYAVAYKPGEFDISEYYKNAIGVTVDRTEPVRIVLKVPQREWQYISTQPWHESMKMLEMADGFVRFEVTLIVNFELKSMLLSFGGSIEVIEPQSLRDWISKEWQLALDRYKSL
jgi:predicted DNA-binding transcriptional regulator YafY